MGGVGIRTTAVGEDASNSDFWTDFLNERFLIIITVVPSGMVVRSLVTCGIVICRASSNSAESIQARNLIFILPKEFIVIRRESFFIRRPA